MSGFCVTHYDGKANIIWAEVPSVIWTEVHPTEEIVYYQRV